MKTVIGNWDTDLVTAINVRKDKKGLFITQQDMADALARMQASPGARLRFVAVKGAILETHEFEVRNG